MSNPGVETIEAIDTALRTGASVRLHLADGEVLVAQILERDPDEIIYRVVTSSRPEKYAICDSTGFVVPLHAIHRAQLLRR